MEAIRRLGTAGQVSGVVREARRREELRLTELRRTGKAGRRRPRREAIACKTHCMGWRSKGGGVETWSCWTKQRITTQFEK
jgi:hypothetical protein